MKVDQNELLNGLILLVFSALIWWKTTNFPDLEEGYPGPALFPRLICLGFIFSGIVLVVRAFRGSEAELLWRSSPSGLVRLGLGLLLIGLYPVLQELLTFAPALGIVCFGIALLLGLRLWVAGLMALVTVGFIFLTFNQLLNVPL